MKRKGELSQYLKLPSDSIAQWLEHTIADRVVPCSNHGGVLDYHFFATKSNPANPNVARDRAVNPSTAFIMKSPILVVLLGFVASTCAAALTLQSPKFTVSSPNGEHIRSEPYVPLSSHLVTFERSWS